MYPFRTKYIQYKTKHEVSGFHHLGDIRCIRENNLICNFDANNLYFL